MSLYYAYIYYSARSETHTVTLDDTILSDEDRQAAETHLIALGELEDDAVLIHRSEQPMPQEQVNAWYDDYMEHLPT